LTALERRDRLLSTCASRGKLGHILPALLHGLRQEGGCTLALDSGHTMRLELPPPPRPPPPKVAEHLVPALLARPDAPTASTWDLTVRRLLGAIDGVRSVSALAAACAVDVPLAQRALQAPAVSAWVS